ncbi:hypothetical protein NDU88_002788 [Pleurodeles waltl]|uniref:Uncharacterized protein n=1 Tax=Pleurodeles waltl TaxID=8319 RepID=A0AAV7WM85_PLEWA|nr:hypothetical protein NDU88_002788 [Pleurodeles waltl]
MVEVSQGLLGYAIAFHAWKEVYRMQAAEHEQKDDDEKDKVDEVDNFATAPELAEEENLLLLATEPEESVRSTGVRSLTGSSTGSSEASRLVP